MATHTQAVTQFYALDMILNVHSDTIYLTVSKARNHLPKTPIDRQPILLNGPIHVTCSIICIIAASAAKSKLGALFLNLKEAKILRLTLEELGWPQHPTQIHVDNTTVTGVVKNTIERNAHMQWKCATYGSSTTNCKVFLSSNIIQATKT